MSIDLTTIFQAMPYAQNVAHAELVHPEAQLAASQAFAQQLLTEEKKQTAKIEQQDAAETVGEEKQHKKSDHPPPHTRRAQQPEAEETQPSNPTPFAGHIIDKKI
jgi:hypothetical protein